MYQAPVHRLVVRNFFPVDPREDYIEVIYYRAGVEQQVCYTCICVAGVYHIPGILEAIYSGVPYKVL